MLLIQFLIRTNEINIGCTNGLIGCEKIYGDESRKKIQAVLKQSGIEDLWNNDEKIQSNIEFVQILKKNLVNKFLN